MDRSSSRREFPGFRRPYYTVVPDDLFDDLLPDLSGAELKVLLYVIRRTFGFKKDADTISLQQIGKGITTKDGRQLDRGTGLSEPTVVSAIKGLIAKNIIVATRQRSAEKGDEPTRYSLVFTDEPVLENARRGGEEFLDGGLKKVKTQETVLQETVEQETDPSNFRLAPNGENSPYDTDRQTILAYVDDFAREFADQASLKASTTRAYHLFQRSGLDVETFTAAMLEARAIAKERSAAIRTATTEPGRPFPTKRKMGYFFAVLEHRLGLKEGSDTS